MNGELTSICKVLLLTKVKVPLMVTAAELDPLRFVEQFEKLLQVTCEGPNGCAKGFMLPQHSHISETYSLNTSDTRLADQILAFMKAGK